MYLFNEIEREKSHPSQLLIVQQRSQLIDFGFPLLNNLLSLIGRLDQSLPSQFAVNSSQVSMIKEQILLG